VIFLLEGITPKGRNFHPKRLALDWRKKEYFKSSFPGKNRKTPLLLIQKSFPLQVQQQKKGGLVFREG